MGQADISMHLSSTTKQRAIGHWVTWFMTGHLHILAMRGWHRICIASNLMARSITWVWVLISSLFLFQVSVGRWRDFGSASPRHGDSLWRVEECRSNGLLITYPNHYVMLFDLTSTLEALHDYIHTELTCCSITVELMFSNALTDNTEILFLGEKSSTFFIDSTTRVSKNLKHADLRRDCTKQKCFA